MLGWVGRLVARRAIWIIAGLIIYGILNTVGVKAYVYDSGNASMTDGAAFDANVIYGPFTFEPDDVLTATITQSFSSGNIDMNCSNGNFQHYNAGGPGTVHTWTNDGQTRTACYIVSWSHSTGKTGAIAWAFDNGDPAPTPTPTPTPTATPTPTPTPTPAPVLACDPSCVVTLSAADVTRMENLSNTVVLALGLLIVGVAILTVLVYKP